MKINETSLEVQVGNITKIECDAIVNAANSTLLGGGGVDGAIHRAGGPAILVACIKIIARIGKLKAGNVVTTTAGNLPAKFVIHTVGPVYRDGARGEAETLANCYANSLAEADSHAVESIAFPSISTGAYRYPADDAAKVAVAAVRAYLEAHPETKIGRVIFVAYNDSASENLKSALSDTA